MCNSRATAVLHHDDKSLIGDCICPHRLGCRTSKQVYLRDSSLIPSFPLQEGQKMFPSSLGLRVKQGEDSTSWIQSITVWYYWHSVQSRCQNVTNSLMSIDISVLEGWTLPLCCHSSLVNTWSLWKGSMELGIMGEIISGLSGINH